MYCGWKGTLTTTIFFAFMCSTLLAEPQFLAQSSCRRKLSGLPTVSKVLDLDKKKKFLWATSENTFISYKGKRHQLHPNMVYWVNVKNEMMILKSEDGIKTTVDDVIKLEILGGNVMVSCRNSEVRAKREFGIDLLLTTPTSNLQPSRRGRGRSLDDTTQLTTSNSPIPTSTTLKNDLTTILDFTTEQAVEETTFQSNEKPAPGNINPVTTTFLTTVTEEYDTQPPPTDAVSTVLQDRMTTNSVHFDTMKTFPAEKDITTIPSTVNAANTVWQDEITTVGDDMETFATEGLTTPLSTVNISITDGTGSWNASAPSPTSKILKGHLLYIVLGGTLLLLFVLVIMIVGIIERTKRRQKRSSSNQDYFMTSNYDDSLIRHSGGGNSNVVQVGMYSEVDPEHAPVPHELDERVMTFSSADTDQIERPRCLADY